MTPDTWKKFGNVWLTIGGMSALKKLNQQKKCNDAPNIFLHLCSSPNLYPLVTRFLKDIISLLNSSS